ncbi:MFS transporter [Leucobacter sp. M11]|uniref:MFS transporter n=1 Tax=Leucobacter sp. M11 TaxID=2993565 RepID=UPI002D80967B|nr:MFS transporter [Leucobacter sp. M11]MEB4614168.1 MFS transporter [Leucobacter sp. M11]
MTQQRSGTGAAATPGSSTAASAGGSSGRSGASAAPKLAFGLIGFLFFVEIVSGIIQGYYVPLISDLVTHLGLGNDADFNIFEGTQLLLAALVVPILAKLGDMYGHRRILLLSTVVAATATWALAFSENPVTFLIAWTLQGVYTVWLPLEIAIIFMRGRQTGRAAAETRRAAAFLIVGLESGAILGAVGAGQLFGLFGGDADPGAAMVPTLIVPAVFVSLAFFAVLFGVPKHTPPGGRTLDGVGFLLLSTALLLVTGGLTLLKFNGAGTWWVWALMIAGLVLFVPFVRWELRQDDPAVDVRVLASPQMWPVMLTAMLIGISLLGAQAPLSTFAGTDPAEAGFGLGLSAGSRSILIGVYLISMIAGALVFPWLSRTLSPRRALIVAAFLVTIGYALFLPFHNTVPQVFTNMCVAGIGSGILMGALPAAAAAAAPAEQTGVATAMTNTTKTIGGSIASTVFAIVLVVGLGDAAGGGSTHASLTGYLTVWSICAGGALLAAISLFLVPKVAFTDAER